MESSRAGFLNAPLFHALDSALFVCAASDCLSTLDDRNSLVLELAVYRVVRHDNIIRRRIAPCNSRRGKESPIIG